MSETAFANAFGTFELHRLPHVNGLKAWDGADHLLLDLAAACTARSALVVNDGFGALACALHALQPVSWSDSHTAHRATQQNWQRNALTGGFTALPATAAPGGPFDLVLWRVPKSQPLFEQQIARLAAVLQPSTTVLAGGMDKHLLPDAKALLARLGGVTTLPGQRKAHAFRIEFDPALPAPRAPRPVELALPEYGLVLKADANVFAREKLDIGARFFIEQFAHLSDARRVADLGCGNGVLGLVLAKRRPSVEIHAFDESYQAVASACANWRHNIGEPDPGRFHTSDGLGDWDGPPFELILCNPPFHQQHVIGDHVARRLFAQAQRHLCPGGELWVVGNRHLGHHVALRRLFGNCRQIAAHPKFVVLAARLQGKAGL